MKRTVLLVLLASQMPACTPDRGPEKLVDPTDEGTLVLDAVLIVDRPFPPVIFLSRTLSPVDTFTPATAAEPGAEIFVTSAGVEVARYADGAAFGRYVPADPRPLVLPETTYEIVVRALDGRILTGSTHTPPRLGVEDWLLLEDDAVTERLDFATFEEAGAGVYTDPRNQVPYGDGLLEARFPRPDVPAFQVAVLNLEEDSPLVVDPDFFSDQDLADLDRFLSSPPIIAGDGVLRLPWLAIYYEGRTLIRIYALDDNWYDLIRSTPGLDPGGGSSIAFGTNAGEGFERPLFRLEGGIGLFGSASVDSGGFNVLPAE